MTHRLVGLGFGLLILLVQAGCNSDDTPPYTRGTGGGGGNGVSLCQDEGGPTVEILEPVAVSDLASEDLVTDPDLQIQCRVTSTGETVDDSSVAIRVYGDEGAEVAPSVANRGDGLFEATASIAGFPNGAVRVTCEASNERPSGACSGAEVNTLLDLGPGVRILNPAASGTALSGGMEVRFELTRLPVTESDDGSALSSSEVVVAGQVIPSMQQSTDGNTGTFVAPVRFDDPALYETPLDGAYQVVVSATNGRGVTRSATVDFIVDAEGPGIVIDEPILGTVIGGATDVIATVSDPSGIDSTQVSFYIGSEEFDMLPVPGASGRFRGSFDANRFPTSVGEVTIDVVAFDLAGNRRVAAVIVELDGVPPILEMNPALVREGREKDDSLECSALFNPVGEEAIGDGDVVFPVSQIRARIEDRANPTASYKSGLDYGSVQVWLIRGLNTQLVTDSDDADSTCDAINPDLLPGNQAGNTPAVAIDLVEVTPTGEPDFLPAQSFGAYSVYNCLSGTDDGPGDEVCETTSLQRIIPDNDEPSGSVPAIFAKGPLTDFYCMGDPFDWQTTLDGIEGEGCMAVVASDVRGNTSVSPPLRVCFTKADPRFPLPPDDPCFGFAPDLGASTCTDGCTGARFPLNELIGPFD